MKDVTNEFKLSEGKFRGWLKHEFDKKIVFSGHLPGKPWQNKDPTEDANEDVKEEPIKIEKKESPPRLNREDEMP